jgi:hypothetical protein
LSRAVDIRIREWLPQIAHFNIFVLAHKNANEPAAQVSAGVAETRQNSGSCVISDVIPVLELKLGMRQGSCLAPAFFATDILMTLSNLVMPLNWGILNAYDEFQEISSYSYKPAL